MFYEVSKFVLVMEASIDIMMVVMFNMPRDETMMKQ
jgi:hypothetical protein